MGDTLKFNVHQAIRILRVMAADRELGTQFFRHWCKVRSAKNFKSLYDGGIGMLRIIKSCQDALESDTCK